MYFLAYDTGSECLALLNSSDLKRRKNPVLKEGMYVWLSGEKRGSEPPYKVVHLLDERLQDMLDGIEKLMGEDSSKFSYFVEQCGIAAHKAIAEPPGTPH